jgi:ribosome-binding factor A
MRHALVDVLARGDVRDPDVAGASITVTEVRVSPDLKNATAFVLPLGGKAADAVLAGLARSAPYLRGQVAKLVNLRHAPRLGFALDTSFDRAEHIDRLLRRPDVAADLAHDDDLDDGGEGRA